MLNWRLQSHTLTLFISLSLSHIHTPPLPALAKVAINTTAPFVLRVDSDTPDGMYYPGQYLDLKVVFSKPVSGSIIPASAFYIYNTSCMMSSFCSFTSPYQPIKSYPINTPYQYTLSNVG